MGAMQLMAETVIPHFRAPDGKPTYMRSEPLAPQTVAEHAARDRPALDPQVRLNGELTDPRVAHARERDTVGHG